MNKLLKRLARQIGLLRRERDPAEVVLMQFLRLIDRAKIVTGLAPILPSSSTPDYVSMKVFQKLTALIIVDNATTVTGSAITLKQASDVAATGEKTLAFSKMWGNTDTDASDTLTETTVTADAFTTDATNAKNLLYVLEVDADDLDQANNFDCVRVGTGDATAAIVAVIYILHGSRYQPGLDRSAITD